MATRQQSETISMAERVSSMAEVKRGLKPHQALAEAARCLFCHDAPCVKGCPVGIDIPGFIRRIAQRNTIGAARLIRQSNPLGSICARVCPAESLCEKSCTSSGIAQPIAIADLQRYATDQELARGIPPMKCAASTGRNVAVVGAGPAGLTCAVSLASQGESVTVFDRWAEPGGTMRYGIPAYRLPREILAAESVWVLSTGVKFVPSTEIGRDISFDELVSGYDAVFICAGLGQPENPRLPGDDVAGVASAYSFLRFASDPGSRAGMRSTDIPDPLGRVVVLGGGNVAVDAACVAARLGADSVTIAYRRSEAEMPAWPGEVEFAREEGVEFRFLLSPSEVLGSEGKVVGVKMARMRLLAADGSSRPKPAPTGEPDELLGADTVVLAFGQGPNEAVFRGMPGLVRGDSGMIRIDPFTGATSVPGVFAGGDAANGGTTVVRAVREGLAAAAGIRGYLDSRVS
ncbi:MAG: NAD(P)-dependent oxidoreductase [Clostridia bacterium]|nr:NAD(P)-dependent oxidoreductase [Clostridia bacterium]